MKGLLKEIRAEGQMKALVEDLIEAYRERQGKALDELSGRSPDLAGPWRKLKREMDKVKETVKEGCAGEMAGTRLQVISSRREPDRNARA
jgi:hypothetical protein